MRYIPNQNDGTVRVTLKIQKRNESPNKSEEEAQFELNAAFVEDPARTKHLRWKVDLRFLPLCAFIYLLNYLDRGNIGAAKIMNEETKDGEQSNWRKSSLSRVGFYLD